MSQDGREYELALEALRGESRTPRDKERVRERLVMRGVALGAGLGAAPASAAALKASSGWATLTKLLACAAVATAVGVVASRPRAAQPAARLSVSNAAWDEGHEPDAPRPHFEQHPPEARVKSASPPAVKMARVSEVREPANTNRKAEDRADLAKEIALLSAAATALRAGDIATAARLLDQHEREFPTGFLRAERETARGRVTRAQAAERMREP